MTIKYTKSLSKTNGELTQPNTHTGDIINKRQQFIVE